MEDDEEGSVVYRPSFICTDGEHAIRAARQLEAAGIEELGDLLVKQRVSATGALLCGGVGSTASVTAAHCGNQSWAFK